MDPVLLEEHLLSAIRTADRVAFDALLLEVHAFQKSASPAYAAYCERQPTATHWKEIPALPQRLFKETALRCFPADETERTFRTSGTTGEGYGEHHFRTLRLYEAAATRGWELAGLAGSRVLALLPDPVESPHSSLSQMARWLCRDEKAFFVHGGAGDWHALRKTIEESLAPLVLFGTALAFLDWFEALGGARVTLPRGSVAVETGGYKGSRRDIAKPALYALFTERLGLPGDAVINEYGMTELSSQFYARGVGTPHFAPPWARGLVIDPSTGAEVEEGQPGVLRLFDAANLWSVCAVQTQDLAIRRGDDFELIGRDPAALPRGCSRGADEMLLQKVTKETKNG